VSNQPQYSALWRGIEECVLPTCVEFGLGTVVWSPLAMGILTGKYTSVDDIPAGSRAAGADAQWMGNLFRQEVLDAVRQLVPLAREAGVTLAQLALAWCLRQPAVSSAIVGASCVEQVDDNVAATDIPRDLELLDQVTTILAPVSVTKASRT